MSNHLKPGLYHIRSANIQYLPPPPTGGMFATNNGQGATVTVNPARPPFAEKQVFNVLAVGDPAAASYKILLYNETPIIVPGWAYEEDKAGQPIVINLPKEFRIEPVLSGAHGIYSISLPTILIDVQLLVGVDEPNNNDLIIKGFPIGLREERPVWQFISVKSEE